jgi:hypothetical protein
MNYYNKSKFQGYKVRPVYLERVNNYLNGVMQNQVAQEEEKVETHSSTSISTLPLQQTQQHTPVIQPQQVQQEERKVSASDLRNKRSQLQNNSYNYSNRNQFGRSKPSYRVNVSYANGSFQTDGL